MPQGCSPQRHSAPAWIVKALPPTHTHTAQYNDALQMLKLSLHGDNRRGEIDKCLSVHVFGPDRGQVLALVHVKAQLEQLQDTVMS